MAVLDIVVYPDPRLKQISVDVSEITDEIRNFCADLTETMFVKDGVGLAAIQVGRPLNIFVLNDNGAKLFINARFTDLSQETERAQEGCLSFPGMFVPIERSIHAEVTAMDLDGNTFQYSADGLMARAAQHEQDHCVGLTFLDRMSHLKRQMVLKKYRRR